MVVSSPALVPPKSFPADDMQNNQEPRGIVSVLCASPNASSVHAWGFRIGPNFYFKIRPQVLAGSEKIMKECRGLRQVSKYPWIVSFGHLPSPCSLCSPSHLGVSPCLSSGRRPVTGHFLLWRALGTGRVKSEDTERCLLLSTILQGQNCQRENALNLRKGMHCTHRHTCTRAHSHTLAANSIIGGGFPPRVRSGNSCLSSMFLVSTAQWSWSFHGTRCKNRKIGKENGLPLFQMIVLCMEKPLIIYRLWELIVIKTHYISVS